MYNVFIVVLRLSKNNYRKMHGMPMKRWVHTESGKRKLRMRRIFRRLKRNQKHLRIKPLIAARGYRRLVPIIDE